MMGTFIYLLAFLKTYALMSFYLTIFIFPFYVIYKNIQRGNFRFDISAILFDIKNIIIAGILWLPFFIYSAYYLTVEFY